MRRYRFSRYGIDFDLKSDYDKIQNVLMTGGRFCDNIEKALTDAEKMLKKTLRSDYNLHAQSAGAPIRIAIQNIRRVRVDMMNARLSIDEAKKDM